MKASAQAEVTMADVMAIERLCEAAVRSGHTQTAIEGWALVLRLRMALAENAPPWPRAEA